MRAYGSRALRAQDHGEPVIASPEPSSGIKQGGYLRASLADAEMGALSSLCPACTRSVRSIRVASRSIIASLQSCGCTAEGCAATS